MRIQEESGFSLVEVLVTIAVVGIAFVSMMGGIRMYIIGGDVHKKEVVNQDVLTRVSEYVKSQRYKTCTAAPAYLTAAPNLPSGYSQTITNFYYWNTAGSGSWSTWSSANLCGTDPGLERVDVKVVSTDNRASDTVSIVMGDTTT